VVVVVSACPPVRSVLRLLLLEEPPGLLHEKAPGVRRACVELSPVHVVPRRGVFGGRPLLASAAPSKSGSRTILCRFIIEADPRVAMASLTPLAELLLLRVLVTSLGVVIASSAVAACVLLEGIIFSFLVFFWMATLRLTIRKARNWRARFRRITSPALAVAAAYLPVSFLLLPFSGRITFVSRFDIIGVKTMLFALPSI